MYHSRTKKVASYGRRAHRVVAISGNGHFSSSMFSDLSKEDSDTDKALGSALNEVDEDILAVGIPPRCCVVASSPEKAKGKKVREKNAPVRRPLGSYLANVPNSPAVPPKAVRARVGSMKSIPLGLRKVSKISPYIDVDIVVLDDAGRRLSEERRVTKSNIQINGINDGTTKAVIWARRPTAVKSYALFPSEEEDDVDEEYVPPPKPCKGKRGAKDSTSGPNLRKARKPVQKSSESRTLRKGLPLVDSDSDVPCRRHTSKRAIHTVVISDSEPEVDIVGVSGSSKAEQGRKSKGHRLADVSHPRPTALENTVKRVSEASICELPRRFPPGLLSPVPDRNARAQRVASSKVSSRANIHIDTDTSRSRFRQFTPIKPSRPKAPFIHQPPVRFSPSQLIVLSDDDTSLTIDEELEFALHIADIQLADSSRPSSKPFEDHPFRSGQSISTSFPDQPPASTSQNGSQRRHVPSFLRPLLSECGQLSPLDFVSFIETFPADPIIGFSGYSGLPNDHGSSDTCSFRKVGEASYSEVFGIGNVVLKVVPLLDEENGAPTAWTADWDPPPVSETTDVLKEIVVTRAMGEIYKGFIKLLKAHVVQGPYPQILLNLWDKYDDKKGSESVRPDHFSSTQTYVIIILPNGGPDLENFSFDSSIAPGGSGWRQACSIFWQVVRSLGHAEELVRFEHRDLHWGQILVRNVKKPPKYFATTTHGTVTLDDPSHGVQSTIIDLGLARIDQGQDVSFWTPLTEEIFEGEGEYQYDIYRMMRKHNKDEWGSFMPFTNVMWLHYLADKLINHKHLRAPTCSSQHSRKSMRSDSLTVKEADRRGYECLLEIEQFLKTSIAPVARSVGVKLKRRPRHVKDISVLASLDGTLKEVKSAADVLHLGKKRGWIL